MRWAALIGLAAVGVAARAAIAAEGAEGWPQFRGPTGQGVVESGRAPTRWGEDQNVRWKTPLPGRGWSSPVVLGDQIWMTTAVVTEASAEETEARISGLLPPDSAELASSVSLRALCVDRATGRLLKDIELFQPDKLDVIHSLNSYASPTPVLEPGRVYCHFGTYGNACLDTASGEVLWRRTLPVEHYVGPGSSPVVWNNLLILTYDGADQQFIVALDKATGDTVWKTDRPEIRNTNPDLRKAYSTPLLVEAGDREELVIPGAQWLVAYDPATGDELWRVDHGSGFSVVPRPVAADGVVYFSTGFTAPELVAVRAGEAASDRVLWRSKRQAPTQASPLLAGDRIYTVSDNGVGVCLDAATRELIWQERIGGTYSASPLLADDRVYFFSREGHTTVLRAGANRAEYLASSDLDEPIMATPAVADGVMYLRTAESLYAIAE